MIPLASLLLLAVAPAPHGVCVGQAWVDVGPGERVSNMVEAGYETAIVSRGDTRWSIVALPDGVTSRAPVRPGRRLPGATLYDLGNRVWLARTDHGDYLLSGTGERPGVARVHFDEPGRAACRGWHGSGSASPPPSAAPADLRRPGV